MVSKSGIAEKRTRTRRKMSEGAGISAGIGRGGMWSPTYRRPKLRLGCVTYQYAVNNLPSSFYFFSN